MTSKQTINYFIFIFLFSTLGSINHAIAANYPPNPSADTAWPYSLENSVADVQSRFNTARTNENSQLDTSIPMLTLPSQAEWDSKSDSVKALWLINRERIDRGVEPIHGVESNVMTVAQNYAQYLLDNNKMGHYADGSDPWARLNDNSTINNCHDPLSIAENLAYFWSSGSGWELTIERAIHNWMYEDSASSWGHRQAILWYPYNDNSGTSGMEGFLGIGRASGTHNGWSNSDIIVMNVFDPCSSWVYASDESIPGDLDGNEVLGLEDAILALMVISKTNINGTISLDMEVDGDGKIGLVDAIYILQKIAGLRNE